MPAIKIKFEDEDYKEIIQYKEVTGLSIQRFVTAAIKEKLLNIKAQQAIDDADLSFVYVGDTKSTK